MAIRDAAGRPVPNFTGVVHFTSNDPGAILPFDYTFTAADGGVKTFQASFAAAGNRTLTVTQFGGAGLTTTSSVIQVHAGPSKLLPVAGARDLVFDAARNTLYVTTGSGVIERYSVTTDSLLETWHVGDSLNAADISLDGSALYVQEGLRNVTQSMVRKVNLQTGAVSTLYYALTSSEEGGWDMAIAGDGSLLFGGVDSGALRKLNTATDTFVSSGHASITSTTLIARSADRSRIGFFGPNSTAGPLFTYSGGAYSATTNLNHVTSNSFLALNSNGSAIVLSQTNPVTEIRNTSFAVVKSIVGYGGIAFRPGTNLLYLINQVSQQIEVYDGDNGWALNTSFPIGEPLSGSAPMGVGTAAFSADGTRLFVVAPSGVRVYNLNGDLNPPTVNGTPADQAVAVNGSTGALSFTVADNLTSAGALLVTATSSDPALIPNANLVFGGTGANRTLTVTPATSARGEATITVQVADAAGNAATFSFHVNVTLATQYVTAFVPTGNGARVTFSRPFAVSALNLFDYRDAAGQSVLGTADVTLVGATTGEIVGSLVFNAANTQAEFIATGLLPPDNYTFTLRSATNGFQTTGGELFDGDADGFAGGNYVTSFIVAPPPANAITVSLPHFARGPEQPVNVPASSALGLPIQVSDGGGLTALNFELLFDAGLLDVTNVTLVGGGTATLTPVASGHVQVALTFSTPLASGAQTVAYLTAAVPTSAASRYGEREVLDISALSLTTGGGSVPGIDQDAVHVNAYFGDVGRNGRYDSFDVQQASRMALRLDTGFQQHPLLDPTILADFNGNGRIDSFDVQRLSRLALRLSVSEAAALPSPLPTTTDTDRLTAEEPPKSEPAKTTADPVTPRSDVDGDGAVDVQDVAWAIYYFNRSNNGAAPAEAQGKKLDLNGDRLFDSADILLAVTDLNAKSATAEGEATSGTTTDSESDDLDSLSYLLAEDLVATRKKK